MDYTLEFREYEKNMTLFDNTEDCDFEEAKKEFFYAYCDFDSDEDVRLYETIEDVLEDDVWEFIRDTIDSQWDEMAYYLKKYISEHKLVVETRKNSFGELTVVSEWLDFCRLFEGYPFLRIGLENGELVVDFNGTYKIVARELTKKGEEYYAQNLDATDKKEIYNTLFNDDVFSGKNYGILKHYR